MAPGARSIAQLRARAAQEFLNNTAKVRMGPNVDGLVLPPAVYRVCESGRQNEGPLIVGRVADDAPGLGPPTRTADFAASAKQTFRERAGETLKVVPAADGSTGGSIRILRCQPSHAYRGGRGRTEARAERSGGGIRVLLETTQ
jgi:hypothetical protein